MTRPDWCDEKTWRDALTTSLESVRTAFRDPLMPMEVSMTPIFARQLLSAKEEARKEERERRPFSLREDWMPVSRQTLNRLGDHKTIRAGIGKLSPAACKKAGMTAAEANAVEALWALLEADDFYVEAAAIRNGDAS